MKKLLFSLGLSGAMLLSSVPVMANTVDTNSFDFNEDGVAIIETFSVKTYQDAGNSDEPVDPTKARATVSVEGGEWDYGVKLNALMQVWQYSDYYHNTKYHSATAMMNDKYSDRIYANSESTAKASSPKFNYATEGYGTHKSYYNTY